MTFLGSSAFGGVKGSVARNHLTACAPPARTPNGVRTHAPAVVDDVPAREHGPKLTVLTLHVEEEVLLTLLVLGKEFLELRRSGLGLVAEFDEDGFIERTLVELVDRQNGLINRFHFKTQKLSLEVVSRPLHTGFLEILLRGGDCGLGRNHRSAN